MEGIPSTDLRVVIVTGASGSGKTQVLKCLEDLGFFCVDNLPPALFQKFVEVCADRGEEVRNIALGIDIRERGFFEDFSPHLDQLKAQCHKIELLFLEAQDEVLVRRFSESRRPHPLLPQRPVLEGIRLERERLERLRTQADWIVDTSTFTVHELKQWVNQHFQDGHQRTMQITVVTFGYKYGIPFDVDLIFDVRFLRNPHFVPHLSPLTGEDEAVRRYVLDSDEAAKFLDHVRKFFAFVLPLYARENRSYLTVGVGCTGGRHRSIAIGRELQDMFNTLGFPAAIRHRELNHPTEIGSQDADPRIPDSGKGSRFNRF